MKNREIEVAETIAIFIINRKSEMLLHKKPSEKQNITAPWEPLCYPYDSTTTPYNAAKLYVNQLGIECDFYQAFSPALQRNHIMIAVIKEQETAFCLESESYKWMQINSVLCAMHEHPTEYASWFGVALEGILLYLKNILNTKGCDQSSMQSELQ